MTYINPTPYCAIGAAVLAGAVMVVMAASSVKAEKEVVIIFDDITDRFQDCLLDGGHTTETPTTISCEMADGTVVECNKWETGLPADCASVSSASRQRGQFRAKSIVGNTVIAPSNRTTPSRTRTLLRRNVMTMIRN